MENIDKVIRAKEHTLDEILSNKKYTVDYFQREYKWQKLNIEQMISDLVGEFMDNYKDGDQNPFNVYLGGGIGITVAGIQVSVGYDYGMMNLYKGDDATQSKRSNIKIGVGFAF